MISTKPPLIGIFGGTFDPIHLGHLRAAWEIRESCNLDEIRFIPSYLPPHRPVVAAAQDRLNMLQLAIRDIPGFTLDTREINRRGPSYTFDTITSLVEELNHPDLCLILGMDAFAKIATWHRANELVTLIKFVIMHRPNNALPQDPFAKLLIEKGQAQVKEITPLDISATAIRQELKNKQLPRFLVTNSVLEYIVEHKLYK